MSIFYNDAKLRELIASEAKATRQTIDENGFKSRADADAIARETRNKLDAIRIAIDVQTKQQREFFDFVRRLVTGPPTPDVLFVTMMEDAEMADRIKFGILFPETIPNDVVKAMAVVTIEGEEPQQIEAVAADMPIVSLEGVNYRNLTGFAGPQDATAHAEGVWIDNGGTASTTPKVIDFTLLDTVAPADVDSLGVITEGEE